MRFLHPRAFTVTLTIVAAALWLAGLATALVHGETLPLDPGDSSLTFIGDSLLHRFHGEAKEFSGSAELERNAAPPIQKATLRFKTATLTTFQSDRDRKMRDWLKVSLHPEATFHLESVTLTGGDYKAASPTQPARFQVSGAITLNGVKQPLSEHVLGWRDKDHVVVSGETTIDTLKFGLPQIREAAVLTVGTNVKVAFRFSFVLPAELAGK